MAGFLKTRSSGLWEALPATTVTRTHSRVRKDWAGLADGTNKSTGSPVKYELRINNEECFSISTHQLLHGTYCILSGDPIWEEGAAQSQHPSAEDEPLAVPSLLSCRGSAQQRARQGHELEQGGKIASSCTPAPQMLHSTQSQSF